MLRMQQQWRPNWSSNHQHSVHELQRRLDSGIHLRTTNAQQRWKHLTQSLEQVSPLATLARGYAVALDTEGKPLTSIQQVKIEQSIRVRLRDGSLSAKIIEKDTSKA
jgi:exodeoxyribonuclease VII large subunit